VAYVIQGRAVIPGAARGLLLVSDEPLSFWGGYDAASGEIIDRRHPLSGEYGKGRVLALPFSRGSSTTTAVLLEAIRNGAAPAGILTTGDDSFFALAAIVADEMYGQALPIIALTPEGFAALASGQQATMHPNGKIEIEGPRGVTEVTA
jgi:predicted aconitase with swiveling domain